MHLPYYCIKFESKLHVLINNSITNNMQQYTQINIYNNNNDSLCSCVGINDNNVHKQLVWQFHSVSRLQIVIKLQNKVWLHSENEVEKSPILLVIYCTLV